MPPRPAPLPLQPTLLLLLLAAVGGAACQGEPAPPALIEAGPVIWRLAPAAEADAPRRAAQHLLTLEALSGPLIELAMREEGRALCQRWGEEVSHFLTFVEPDFINAAKVRPLKPADQAAIEDAYQRFGHVAARCMSGGEVARGAMTRVKDLVKPMLRAI